MGLAAPRLLVVVALLAAAMTGCRSVWVHADASEARYQADFTRCSYGVSSEELQQILATPSSPLPKHRPDWKQCMALLGWQTEWRSRSSPPWGLP
jgi:hypothetical protein